MKDYTSTEPVFSDTIKIVERSDPASADNANAAAMQLLQNTLVLGSVLNGVLAVTVKDEVLLLPKLLDAELEGEALVLPDDSTEYSEADEEMEISAGTIAGHFSGGGGGGGGSYVLPVATASTLGGVKIGSGIDVTGDGTISTNVEAATEVVTEVVETKIEDQMGEISQEDVESLFSTITD